MSRKRNPKRDLAAKKRRRRRQAQWRARTWASWMPVTKPTGWPFFVRDMDAAPLFDDEDTRNIDIYGHSTRRV